MTPSKRLLTIVLTLALGFGVWTLAVTFQTADFSSGDVLSASELNTLLNDNFDEAANAIDGKLDTSGGTLTGRTNIEADASSPEDFDTNAVFQVENTADSGSAAVFTSANDDADLGAVTIKQQGTGPALALKSNNGGPLISGAGAAVVTFVVEEDGTIKIGDMGASGGDDPALRLDGSDGTVTNAVGSGLPLAFGYVDSAGSKQSGTSNWTASGSGGSYTISFTDGTSYARTGFAAMVQPNSATAFAAQTGVSGDDLTVTTHDSLGAEIASGFHFVVYKDGEVASGP